MQEVGQGCLLSSVLYVMAAEAFANFTGVDKGIKQVHIGDHEIKIVNFAGDITIFRRYYLP